MKKISIYVVNKKLKPANYYRIVQYAKYIPGAKIYNITPTLLFKLAIYFRESKIFKNKRVFREMPHKISIKRMERFLKKDLKRKPDYVVIQKSMTKRKVAKEIRQLQEELVKSSTLIWDFDDNILEGQEILQEEYDLYCENAKHIIVTSELLKEKLPEQCKERVILLPTTDIEMPIQQGKLEKINQKRKSKMQKKINIIWIATSTNIRYIEPILDILEETAKEIEKKYHKKTVLTVVCDKKIKRNYSYLKIKNIRWTRKKAIRQVRKASIGIMPLLDSEYTRGKGGFKLIQYISTGLPVVASDVGYNDTIFKDKIGYLLSDQESKEGWKKAILKLVDSEQRWESCSKKAYEVWNQYYHYETNLKVWKELTS